MFRLGASGSIDVGAAAFLYSATLNSDIHFPLSRFHVATLALFRAKQLHDGARPRVAGVRHRSWRVALLEVEAAQVSWYLE
jgi:DNA-directed RNA polymerase subunit K/omega